MKLPKVVDLRKWKFSKIVVEDLEIILKVIGLSTKALKRYTMYPPVKRIISLLEKEKQELEAHYNKYKAIKKNRGSSNET